MIKGVNHAHLGPIWYQTFPTPQTSFLVGTFFAASYSKMALGGRVKNRRISSNATYGRYLIDKYCISL